MRARRFFATRVSGLRVAATADDVRMGGVLPSPGVTCAAPWTSTPTGTASRSAGRCCAPASPHRWWPT